MFKVDDSPNKLTLPPANQVPIGPVLRNNVGSEVLYNTCVTGLIPVGAYHSTCCRVDTERLTMSGMTWFGCGLFSTCGHEVPHVTLECAFRRGHCVEHASDHSRASFIFADSLRYLVRLLLVHGRWNYRRACTSAYFLSATFHREIAAAPRASAEH